MNDDDETRLRSLFTRLRSEDEAGAPDFESLMARSRSVALPSVARRRPMLMVLAAAAAALLGVIVIGRMDQHDRAPYSVDLGTTRWRGPTEFLLAVSMDPALSTVPRIGTPDLPWRIP
jgi:hypothetical protein